MTTKQALKMSCDRFIYYMDKIKELEKKNDIFREALVKVDKDSWGSNIYGYVMEDFVDLLSEVMDDKEHLISYFIWDLRWGKDSKDCITDKKRKYSLCNYKQLYDQITHET